MDTSTENWSIESAWKENKAEILETEHIDGFHLAEGTTLVPLDDELYDAFPRFDNTGKTTRIFDDKNRYIDFKQIEYMRHTFKILFPQMR